MSRNLSQARTKGSSRLRTRNALGPYCVRQVPSPPSCSASIPSKHSPSSTTVQRPNHPIIRSADLKRPSMPTLWLPCITQNPHLPAAVGSIDFRVILVCIPRRLFTQAAQVCVQSLDTPSTAFTLMEVGRYCRSLELPHVRALLHSRLLFWYGDISRWLRSLTHILFPSQLHIT